MKTMITAVLSVALLVVVAAAVSQSQDAPDENMPQLSPQQKWLKQLIGEWDVQYKMYMQPGQPPMEADGAESVRMLGDHWVVSEMNSTMMGQPISGMLSVGYDAQKEQFNGTWIDSMSGHLWVYEGKLNDAGDMLTLTTEGPSMEGPDQTAKYKEVITIKDGNTRTFASNMQLANGEWMTILEAEYTRK